MSSDSASSSDSSGGESSSASSDGESSEPTRCLAAYDEGFDADSLPGSWSAAPCAGESRETCRFESIEIDGQERCYLVVAPPGNRDVPRPILLAWHGSDSNGAAMRLSMNEDFPDLQFEQTIGDDALVVYPDGLPHADCFGNPCWDRDPAGRDVAFFDALIERLAEDWSGDASTVLAVGHSRGARFVEVLACHRADSLVAAGAMSAGSNNVDTCPGQLPIWLSHSEDDETIPFSQGLGHLSNWADRNGCEAIDAVTFELDRCVALAGCDAPVTWCPTSEPDWDGHAPTGLADEELWAFLNAQIQ